MAWPAEARGLKHYVRRGYEDFIKAMTPDLSRLIEDARFMFRLRTSPHGAVGVNVMLVWMMLAALLDTETLRKVRFSRKRGEHLRLVEVGVLTGSDYFIHSPNPDNPSDVLYKFPLTPAFEAWTLAEQITPKTWSEWGRKSIEKSDSKLFLARKAAREELADLCNKAVIERDRVCVVSKAEGKACERAYIVPPSKRRFWVEEGLAALLGEEARSTPRRSIVHPMNGLAMRRDLRDAYHIGEFVLLPIRDKWRAHFFDPTSELGKEFDQKSIKLSQEIPRTYLQVRIGMAAFKLAKEFLEQGELPSEARPQTAESGKGNDVVTSLAQLDLE